MRVALFGATGRTGRLVLKKLIENGFEVNVLVRNPEKLNIVNSKIQVIKGDAVDYFDVNKTIEQTNAVISVIGYVKSSQPGFQSIAVQHIVESMKAFNIERLIILTGSGVPHPNDVFTLGNWFLTKIIKIFAKDRYIDGVNQVNILQYSSLQWTVVRAPLLTNGSEKYTFKTGHLPLSIFSHISRADVAQFIIHLLITNDYIHQMPQISY